MYLLGKKADTLKEEDIKRLVHNKVQENKSLDYKKELHLSQDKDRKEFLFDITSLSNTEGGCLIYGIEETKDEKKQNTGTPEKVVGITIDNYDKLSQQIEDIIKGNTEPSISNIILNPLKVDGLNVLVIGISKSLGLPIMVTFNDTNKFYRRRNSGKYSVDVYELNQMFMQNQVLKESAENFRRQRIEKVRGLNVFPILETSSSLFIHIIPFTFQNEQMLDLTNAANMNLSITMKPIFCGGWDTMYNVDGFATFATSEERQKITSYDQLLRNGIYEVYSGLLFQPYTSITRIEMNRMFGHDFIKNAIEQIKNGLTVLHSFHVEGPFIISISIIGLKDGVIYDQNQWTTKKFMTNELYFPSVILPNAETNLLQLLKPSFDILWQGVGYPKSPDIEL
jgi:hypothetical protein